MTETILAVAGVLGALALGAISPGPSFIMVARTAIAGSRRQGVAAALGMGVGAVVFAAIVLFGLLVVLVTVPWLYLALKLAGGAYLVYLAIRIWRGAKEPLVVETAGGAASVVKAFWLGLGAQVSNPKTAVVYGSIFAALLPHDLPAAVAMALPFLVFVIEAGWYCIVALAMSASTLRAAYLRSKTGIDRVVAGVLAGLGVKLVAAAK